jgi:Tfp pilus assembly protein PilN
VVLVISGKTVLWREFAYSTDQRLQIVSSAIRTVLAYTASALSNPPVDGIILQGDKAAELAEDIACDRGMQVEVIDGDGFTDAKCSYGLALSAKGNDEQKGLDLFRTLREEPSILAMFPWRRAALVVFAIACMGFVMWQKVAGLTGEYNNFKQQNASHEWSEGQRTGEIKNERKQLLTEVQAVSKFLSTRIIWSDYLRDLPTRLPTNACLSNIWAVNELKEMSKKKKGRRIKQSLTMRGVTRFNKGVVAPEEIEAFLESLRNVELLRRDFPKVQLAEIKWRREGESEIAMFTVVAMPKKKSARGDDKDEKE